MNRFANLTEWLENRQIIKHHVKVETIDDFVFDPPEPPKPDPAIQKINKADLEDLTSVKGIGPKTASKILDSGPFTDFDNLSEHVRLRADIFESLQTWANS